MRASNSAVAAQVQPHDVPHFDFSGRKLRLVTKQLNDIVEPSPLHEAICKFLESRP